MGDRVINVGDVFPSNNGGEFIVLSIKNYRCVTIEFMDSYKFRVTTDGYSIKKGTVKNPYSPTVYGKGYIGFGDFKPKDFPKVYKKWKQMLERCYCPKRLKKHTSYVGCAVSDSWLNFQNFADWMSTKPHYQQSFELDKDLFSNGLKTYSSSTCTLLPAQINATLYTELNTDELKPSSKTGKYSFRVEALGIREVLGPFDSKEQLALAYKEHRARHLRFLANKWKAFIDKNAYSAIFNWE